MELGAQPPQLGNVKRSQAIQPVGPAGREPDPNEALVGRVRATTHEARGLGAVDETHHAVVAEQQLVRQLPDRGGCGTALRTDGEEKLMLRRGQPRLLGAILRPPQVATQTVPEGRKLPVLAVGENLPV